MNQKEKIVKHLQKTLREGINICNEMEIAMDLKIPFKTVHKVFDELIADGSLREHPIK